eukprot:385443-Pleurochrysis_carterae.AAC.1
MRARRASSRAPGWACLGRATSVCPVRAELPRGGRPAAAAAAGGAAQNRRDSEARVYARATRTDGVVAWGRRGAATAGSR